MDCCVMTYWGRVHDDMFETCIKTFRKHTKALLQVYSDSAPKGKWLSDYNVSWFRLPDDKVKNRRCLANVECIQKMMDTLSDGDRLIVSDIDVYFLDDPFSAFDKCKFDLGVTLRLHSYQFPVNAGLCFINVNKNSRFLFGDKFRDSLKKICEHDNNMDWWVDQRYLNYLFQNKIEGVVDVGWEYNFCPGTDVLGIKLASDMIRRAYESRSVKVLHLKSELKMCIYDGYMEDAVNENPTGRWNWQKNSG